MLTLAITFMMSAMTAPIATAQPSPAQLADRLDKLNQERIERIDRLQITNKITSGMYDGEETISRFEKTMRDGIYVLEPVDDDYLYDAGELAGMADDIYSKMIRNASRIEHSRFNGHDVYKITVDDPDFLSSLHILDSMDETIGDEFDDDPVPESFTLLLDRDALLMRHASFQYAGDGVSMSFLFSDYEFFSGLPIPMVTEMEVRGLDQLVSEEEIAEARKAMQEMEQQLEQMPEAQREMIRQQLLPHMKQFESILESGEPMRSRIQVIDVKVN